MTATAEEGSVTTAPAATRVRRHGRAPKIPPNFFSCSFGLSGLGEFWAYVANYGAAPGAVADVILVLASAVWLLLVVAYLAHLAQDRGTLRHDLLDPIAAPFLSLALIAPILLAAVGLSPHNPTAARALVDVFVCLTVLLAGWFTGQWIYGAMDLDRFHPGYFLPSVAGGLVSSQATAAVGQLRLAEVMFGFGVVSWIVMGSIILGRLLFRPMLPPALQPTLAIEIAPAAVASLAWFTMHGARIDEVITFLAGYGTLMVVAQLRLVPMYRRLPFMPSTWAFTFSWAAVASTVLVWLQTTRVAGYRWWQYVDIVLISLLIGAILLRTAVAFGRRELLPAPAPVAQST